MRIPRSIRGAKGIKNVVENTITHEYHKEHRRTMNVIRSHLQDVYTEEVNKVALSAKDD